MNQASLIQWLKSKRVAVLKGGWSRERSISLKTGAAVEDSFRRMGIPALGIDVRPSIFEDLRKKKIEFCFIALHGAFGEDGRIQSGLDILKIPYTGSGALASGLAMDKDLSKKIFVQSGVPTPEWMTILKSQFKSDPDGVLNHVRPWLRKTALFVKPFDQGSAIGVFKIENSRQLGRALKSCFAFSEAALVEKFVPGRELTVSILGDQALPVVEIIPEHAFYDFHSKYAKGGSRHVVPAPISERAAKQAQAIALKAFQSLKCSVYGRVDILMRKDGRLTVLEVNTIPGMTATSLLPDAARAAGMSFDELVIKIIQYSLK
jgi:D-alanine-D-alanine ligase